MQKQFLILVLLFGFISCQEDVKFNNPSFQGLKDNVFWRAIGFKATLAPDGSLVVEAYKGYEKVTFKTTSAQPQVYLLGNNTSNTAIYVFSDAGGTTIFSTGSDVDEGQIEITEYDAVNKTISGTFKFKAENTDINAVKNLVVNFQQGVFYKIPVVH